MGVSVKFVGEKKLVAKLKKNMDLSTVKKVVQANGAQMQTKAQRKAPVDTGLLKRSIGLEFSDGGLTATVEPTAEYAPYQEWGTRFMESQSFVKPAFNEQAKQFKDDLDKLVR